MNAAFLWSERKPFSRDAVIGRSPPPSFVPYIYIRIHFKADGNFHFLPTIMPFDANKRGHSEKVWESAERVWERRGKRKSAWSECLKSAGMRVKRRSEVACKTWCRFLEGGGKIPRSECKMYLKCHKTCKECRSVVKAIGFIPSCNWMVKFHSVMCSQTEMDNS